MVEKIFWAAKSEVFRDVHFLLLIHSVESQMASSKVKWHKNWIKSWCCHFSKLDKRGIPFRGHKITYFMRWKS